MGWPDWRGECVAIVASGPSANKVGVENLKDRIHCIAINESWQLCPWADILYGADAAWWKLRGGAKEFRGLRVTQDDEAIKQFPGLLKIVVAKIKGNYSNEILTEAQGTVGGGGNSGFQAINLAVQFGATAVALIGFDMQDSGGLHWHGRHPQPLSNPMRDNFDRWRRALDDQVLRLKALGVDVVNCSPVSALTAYPKMTIDDALARWGL